MYRMKHCDYILSKGTRMRSKLLLMIVLMPLLSFAVTRKQLEKDISDKENELKNIEQIIDQKEAYIKDLYTRSAEVCKSIMQSLTEEDRQQLVQELAEFDQNVYDLIVAGDVFKPSFVGQGRKNNYQYKRLKILAARIFMHYDKLYAVWDEYIRCARALFAMYGQLNELSV